MLLKILDMPNVTLMLISQACEVAHLKLTYELGGASYGLLEWYCAF